MDSIEKTVDIDCPIDVVYNQWTQFEEFPRFMSSITRVRQIDDTHVHWQAEILGKAQEWRSVITEQLPDQRISWKSIAGTPNRGSIAFSPLSADQTRITLTIIFEPEGAAENLGAMLGFVDRQVEKSLQDFKTFIEARQQETGAWRGEVRQPVTLSPEV